MLEKIYKITVPTPFPVGEVHMYLLKGEALTLIDAGVKTEEAWDSFNNQLNKLGYKPTDIEQVVVTHHHPDHIGLLDNFQGIPTYGHILVKPWVEKNEEYLQNYEAFFRELYTASGTPEIYSSFLSSLRSPLKYTGKTELTSFLDEGNIIPGHPNFRVIATPGHAQSHLSFFRQKDGLLIGGDLLLYHSSSNPLLEPPIDSNRERPKPLLDYRDSLNKVKKLEVKEVYPGHGPIFSNVDLLIEQKLIKQEKRAERVLELLKAKEPQTAFEICKHIFSKQFKKQFGLTMSDTFGQLDFLLERKLIDVTFDKGIWFYSLKE